LNFQGQKWNCFAINAFSFDGDDTNLIYSFHFWQGGYQTIICWHQDENYRILLNDAELSAVIFWKADVAMESPVSSL
jgi:hypothetical protein